MDLLSATFLLLIVMDPLGNVPLALTLMQQVKRKKILYTAREFPGILGADGISVFLVRPC